MNREFQQYRFARIEAQNITKARLEAQFKDGIGGLQEIEEAIARLLTAESTCTLWRKSEAEQAGSRDGTRMAALEFYWAHRPESRPVAESNRNEPRFSALAPVLVPPIRSVFALVSALPLRWAKLRDNFRALWLHVFCFFGSSPKIF
jgi:hypothetical protein